NMPWLMILGLGFLTMLFNGIKYGVIAYYFNHYIGDPVLTGRYFIVLLLVSIVAALVAGYLTRLMGKKTLFAISLLVSGVLTTLIFFVEPENVTYVFVIGGIAEFFAAFMP